MNPAAVIGSVKASLLPSRVSRGCAAEPGDAVARFRALMRSQIAKRLDYCGGQIAEVSVRSVPGKEDWAAVAATLDEVAREMKLCACDVRLLAK